MNNIEYALATMDAGVMVLSGDGTVSYSNPRAKAIFNIGDERPVRLLSDIFSDTNGKNDGLVDLVIDIVCSRDTMKSRIISYTDRAGNVFYLLMSCSKTPEGEFVFTFSDQTELVSVEQKRIDSTAVLTSFFIISCLWTVGVSIWMETGKVFDVKYLTIIVEAIATIDLIILLYQTSFSLKDFGLSTETLVPTLKRTVVRVLILLAVFCGVKLAFLKFKPGFFREDVPFWDWSQTGFGPVRYLCTAFVQEFLSRGGIQESLSRVFEGKHRKDYAIFLTSLFFMSLHFQYGLRMMFGAGVLSVLLGYIYKEDRNIYGVTIIHYCFGMFTNYLNFL